MKLLTIEQSDNALEALDRLERRISMESEHLANFSSTVRGAIPTLVDSASNFLSRFTSKDSQITKVEAPQEIAYTDFMSFLKLMEEHKYMSVTDMDVYVPEGFKGHLLDYSHIVKACLEHANSVVADVLNPYAIFLSKIITNKDATLRTTKDLGFLAKIDVQREALTSEITKYFTKGSTATKTTIGKIIARNTDWKPLLVSLSEIRTLSQTLKPEVVQQSVKDTVSLLNSLKMAVNNGDLDNASGQILKTLSEATLSTAREVEFYSITIYRAFILGNLISENINSISKSLKK